MKLNVYRAPGPPPTQPLPVVVFWHGGTWKNGGLWRYGFVGRALAKMGVVAVLVGYRKYPQIRYPTFVDDAALAIKWVDEQISEYGGDPQRVVIAGHSAGAHTASALAYLPGYWEKTGLSRQVLKGFIGLSGPYDFYPRPDLQPIFPLKDLSEPWRIGKQLPSTLSPALVVHGYFDPIVKIGYAKTFVQRIKSANGRVAARYLPIEHMLTLFSFVWPLRLLPRSPWRSCRAFVRQVFEPTLE